MLHRLEIYNVGARDGADKNDFITSDENTRRAVLVGMHLDPEAGQLLREQFHNEVEI